MRPDDTRPNPQLVVPPSRQTAPVTPTRSQSQEAAANIVRSQIDAIYHTDPNATMAAADNPDTESHARASVTPGPGAVNLQAAHQQQQAENPYERTHNESQHEVQSTSWQRYHSAWQNYYQQYYERYYVSQVREAKKSLEAQTAVHRGIEPTANETISTDEAMYDLRSRLRSQISKRATKVRKSRHFIPVVAALSVMLVFLFLQYNRVLFATVDAYVRPGSLSESNFIPDPNASKTVSSDPRLIIPTISVDVPIIWDADAASEDSLNAAMDKGVAWFNIQGANAKPGEMGNFVVSGHSSNDWLDKGDYKFIFAPLERMKAGDTIYVNYNSTRYTYTITSTKVVKPTDVAALQIGNDKPYITLITCTPLGTALNRLLVFGEQVSPDPKAAAKPTSTSNTSEAAKMPANSPTFFQRIFGLGN